MQEAFSDDEVETFCFDNFIELHRDFSSGMTKGEKINLLLEYCEQHAGVEALFRALQEKRPTQYQKRFGSAPPPAQFEVTFTPTGAASSVEITLNTLEEAAQLQIKEQTEEIAFYRKLAVVLLVVGLVFIILTLLPNPWGLAIALRLMIGFGGLFIGSLSGLQFRLIDQHKLQIGKCELWHRHLEYLKKQPVIDAETRAQITLWMNQVFEGVTKAKTA